MPILTIIRCFAALAAAFAGLTAVAWGITILSNVWGYRDNSVATYILLSLTSFAIAIAFFGVAVLTLLRARAMPWLALGVYALLLAFVPYMELFASNVWPLGFLMASVAVACFVSSLASAWSPRPPE